MSFLYLILYWIETAGRVAYAIRSVFENIERDLIVT